MFSAGVTGIRTYGSSALAFLVIALLGGVLIERRILTAQPTPGGALSAVPLLGADDGGLGLRRIVLDPCTGLEKARLAGVGPASETKAD